MIGPDRRIPLVFDVIMHDGSELRVVAHSRPAVMRALGVDDSRLRTCGRLDDFERKTPVVRVSFADGVDARVLD